MGDRILQVNNLRKSFGGLVAVNDLDFSLKPGEILGLIGPNGSGKTTLFNLIAGVHRPDRGTVFLGEKEITGLPSHEISAMGVARTFQIPLPFHRFTVFENILVARYFGSAPARTRHDAFREAEEILDFIQLSSKRDVLSSSLGVLDRKRLELGRALATRPRVLLLDEIMGGLNPTEVLSAMALVRSVRDSGVAVIFVEHVMRAVLGISDRVVVLYTGSKLFEGAPSEAVNDARVIECYLGVRRNAKA
jgi:branched-chain amino acid transport system ATP-binding protein